MKRIELIIIENRKIEEMLDLINANIGSIYFKVTPKTLSLVRSTLVNSLYTTRLFIVQKNKEVIYYIYGKKKKNQGVFNEHCKNSLVRTNTPIEQIITVSSNRNDLIVSDSQEILNIGAKMNRKAEIV